MHEFDLIQHLFMPASPQNFPVGNGDDCAVFPLFAHNLAVSTDTMVEGVHFFPDVDPYTLGKKLLAVNLSDLAAMGAKPIGCVLSLGVPQVELPWLEAFATGLREMARQFDCPLVGGDTVRSLALKQFTLTIMGTVEATQALGRNKAQLADDIWVSGVLGAADVALKILLGQLLLPMQASYQAALEQPTPRVRLGQALLGKAHAAIDISDGLCQDLSHIARKSGLGATVELELLPIHPDLKILPFPQQLQSALYGGDVYELCFTAPQSQRDTIQQLVQEVGVPLTRIGRMVESSGVALTAQSAEVQPLIASLSATSCSGYQHF